MTFCCLLARRKGKKEAKCHSDEDALPLTILFLSPKSRMQEMSWVRVGFPYPPSPCLRAGKNPFRHQYLRTRRQRTHAGGGCRRAANEEGRQDEAEKRRRGRHADPLRLTAGRPRGPRRPNSLTCRSAANTARSYLPFLEVGKYTVVVAALTPSADCARSTRSGRARTGAHAPGNVLSPLSPLSGGERTVLIRPKKGERRAPRSSYHGL